MMNENDLECHTVENISLSLRKDGKIEISLGSKDLVCHNVFNKDAARSIVRTMDDITSGRVGRYIAAETESETVGGIEFDREPHIMIRGDTEEDRFEIFVRDKMRLFGYVSDCKDPAIVTIRDVLRMWTA